MTKPEGAERRTKIRRADDFRHSNPSVIVYCADFSYRAWIRFEDLQNLSSAMLLDNRLLTWQTTNASDDGFIQQHGQPVPPHLRPAWRSWPDAPREGDKPT